MPSALNANHKAPCCAKVRNADAATSGVYPSRMPASGPMEKLFQNGRQQWPDRSRGTPRTTVSQRRAERDHTTSVLEAENTKVPQPLPRRVLDLIAELDRNAAQNQKPYERHQGQVESAEGGRRERKREIIAPAAVWNLISSPDLLQPQPAW